MGNRLRSDELRRVKRVATVPRGGTVGLGSFHDSRAGNVERSPHLIEGGPAVAALAAAIEALPLSLTAPYRLRVLRAGLTPILRVPASERTIIMYPVSSDLADMPATLGNYYWLGFVCI